ncbi:MAG: polysaccharide biosynthesis C-terminal domain-containing protein [Bacteroidales bacterium]|nr:polysaccharide biosynthesis C-terminal domain-containing protein [Bacteroidales bacterium]MCF8344430.1 polysaccharide biosynthesis C-terminal domain-containing protein [Bacteroidales bacterium]MCF8351451.1 polysaccharide biosynthesis C-terminal domain-containing protein [Bacteroidales bacterium]MCF8375625.1 polysaccharide biosynthesis C-terminal domain-containing protein [Bacteroidales bacterium]MCF8400792.1 polysaccharide biosynthesis C-terminal domain-containing protein [Bacteroidales bact
MGIIQKQAVRGTIYSYLGIGIGFVTTVLLYPRIFSQTEIGLLRLLVAYSVLFAQFASLGFPRATTMLFTYFRDKEKKHNGFLFITLMVSFIGLIIALILLFTLKPYIIGRGAEKSEIFSEYFYYIIPLVVFTLYYLVFDNYYKVLFNSVQGTFLKEFFQRIFILLASVFVLLGIIDFKTYVIVFLISYLLPTLILLILLIRDRQFFLKPDFSILTSGFRKKIISVSFFGILTSFSGILVLNIDSIMVNAYLNLESTGIYAITFYFGQVILISSRSLLKISSVVIADSWKNNDSKTINTIYYKSCLNQAIIASLLFIGIWGNIHNIFDEHLLGSAYEPGKYVILFISLACLIQMAGGTSNMILFTSPAYRIHTYLMAVLVVILIFSNVLFIPVLGITGAALASAISFFVFNVIKYIYLSKRFGFRPYDHRILLVFLIAGFVYLLNLLIPQLDNFYMDIIIRSAMMTIVFTALILLFKLSVEINDNFAKIFLSGQE